MSSEIFRIPKDQIESTSEIKEGPDVEKIPDGADTQEKEFVV